MLHPYYWKRTLLVDRINGSRIGCDVPKFVSAASGAEEQINMKFKLSRRIAFISMILCCLSFASSKHPDCSDITKGMNVNGDCGWKFYKSSEDHPIHMGNCAPCHVICDRPDRREECQLKCPVYHSMCIARPTAVPVITPESALPKPVNGSLSEPKLDSSMDHKPPLDHAAISGISISAALVIVVLSVAGIVICYRRRIPKCLYGDRLGYPVQCTGGESPEVSLV